MATAQKCLSHFNSRRASEAMGNSLPNTKIVPQKMSEVRTTNGSRMIHDDSCFSSSLSFSTTRIQVWSVSGPGSPAVGAMYRMESHAAQRTCRWRMQCRTERVAPLGKPWGFQGGKAKGGWPKAPLGASEISFISILQH